MTKLILKAVAANTPSNAKLADQSIGQVDTSSSSQQLTVNAQPNTQYRLVDSKTGQVVKKQTVVRKGNALQIEVDGNAVAQIENFFPEAVAEGAAPANSATYLVDTSPSAEATYGVVSPQSTVVDTASGSAVLWSPGMSALPLAEPVAFAPQALTALSGISGATGLAVGTSAVVVASFAGDSSDTAGTSANPKVAGSVFAGPVVGQGLVAGLKVQAFDDKGNSLGTADVKADGSYVLALTNPNYKGVMVLKVFDDPNDSLTAKYTDEATGKEKTFDMPLLAVVNYTGDATTTQTVNITPVTHVAALLAGVTSTSEGVKTPTTAFDKDVVQKSNIQVAQKLALAVDDLTSADVQTSDKDTVNGYGKLLALLSQTELTNDKSTSEVADSIKQAIQGSNSNDFEQLLTNVKNDSAVSIKNVSKDDLSNIIDAIPQNDQPESPQEETLHTSSDGTKIYVDFNEFLSKNTAETKDFKVTLTTPGSNGDSDITNLAIIDSVSFEDFRLVLNLSPTTKVKAEHKVKVSYTDPTRSDDLFAVQSVGGVDADSFNPVDVQNNVSASPPVIKVKTGQVLSYLENQKTHLDSLGTVVLAEGTHNLFRFSDTKTNFSKDGLYFIDSEGKLFLTSAGLAAKKYSNDFETKFNGGNTLTYDVQAGDVAGNWSASVTITLEIQDGKEPPTLSVPRFFTVTEDVKGELVFDSLTFADDDSTDLTVTLSVADGTIDASTGGNVTVGGLATLRTFTGTVAELNTYFKTPGNITYTGASNANGPRKLTIEVKDDQNLSTTAYSNIKITPVNDAPVRKIGTTLALTVDEDSANSTAVSLGLSAYTYGPGGGSDETSQTLTYKITNIPSSITLWKADGTTQVNNNDTLSLADIQGLKYKTVANSNNSTPANITWTVTDDGASPQTLTETLSVTVNPVNDAPVRTGTTLAPIVVNEDSANSTAVSLGLSAYTYGPGGGSDEDSQTLTYKITGIPSSITLWKTDGTTQVNNNDTLSLTELQGLMYKTVANANNSTPANITWTVTDDSASPQTLTETLSVTVNPVSDTWSVSNIPPNFFVDEDTSVNLYFTDNLITDVDSTTLTVTLSVVDGTINATAGGNVTVGGTSNSRTFTGTAADLNAFFKVAGNVTYTGASNLNGTRTLTLTVSDGSVNTTPVTSTINITAVNDAPVASGSATLAAVNEDTAAPAGSPVSSLFAGNFNDSLDNLAGGSSANTLAGVAITANAATAAQGKWQYQVNSTGAWLDISTTGLADANAFFLAANTSLRFLPNSNYNGTPGALTVRLVDNSGTPPTNATTINVATNGNNTAFSSSTVSLGTSITAVNDAPIGTNATISIAQNGSKSFTSNDFGFSDIDGNTLSAVMITTLPVNGTLKLNGTPVTVNQVIPVGSLSTLVYAPAANTSGNNYASIGFKLLDNGGTTNGGVDTSTSAYTLTINVSANVLPSIVGSNTAISYTENEAPKTIFTNLTITDPDNTTLATATVSITNNFVSGQDELAFVNVPATMGNITGSYSNGVMSLSSTNGAATLAQWEAAIKAVTYRNTSENPTANARTISISINDGIGNSTTSAINTVNVIAVNDAPTITSVLPTFTVNEDIAGNLQFTGTPFADVDSTTLTVTLSVVDGTINATTVSGVTVSGSATSRTFAGSASALNTYFATAGNITYQGALNVNGTKTLSISVNDGSTANNTASGSATINITAVNDAPVASGSATLAAVNEDTAAPAGSPVSSLFAGNFSDVDGALAGVAVVSNTALASQGTWEYKDTNGSWSGISTTASNSAAIYIRADALIRFKPSQNYNGTPPSLVVKLVDNSPPGIGNLASGITTDTSNSAFTQFSTTTVSLTTSITSVNDAPIGTNATISIAQNGSKSFTSNDFGFSDIDGNTLSAVMITTLPVNGTLKLNGTPVTVNQVIPVGSLSTLGYAPAANTSGNNYASIGFKLLDNGGTTNGGVDTSTSAYTLTINVNANIPPTLAGTNTLSYTENDLAKIVNPNITVADSDNPTLASATVSITSGFVASQDTLNFASNATFGNITGSYSATSGVLTLTSQGGTATLAQWQAALRSVTYSNSSENPTTTSRTISFVVNDGATANNTASGSATINITAVNDAPVASGSPTLAAVNEDSSTTPAGALVSALFASNFSDVDGTMAGVAITANAATAAQGKWQYQTNGTTTWTDIGTTGLADATALFLAANSALRFLPNSNYNGTPGTLTVRLVDNSGTPPTNATTINVATNGNNTAFSSSTVSLGTSITAVNDAPVRTAGTTVALTVNEDSANSTAVSLGLSAYTYGPGGGSDESSQTLTYKITGIPSSITLWKTDGTTQVNNNDTLSLTELQGLMYKTVANANNSTPANITWTVTDNGSSTSPSVNSLTESLSVTVNPVNDAPLLTATPVNSTFTEGVNSTQAAPVNVFSNASVSTIEAGQNITSLTFTVSGLSNGANDVVVVDGSVLSINAGTSGTTATNGMTYAVSIPGAVATITLTKAGGITAQQAQTLINGITYQNTRVDNPTAGSRLFTLTQIKDDGGITNGGVDTTALNILSTVSVVAVNDAPTITGVPSTFTVNEDIAGNLLFTGTPFADVDSTTLTVTLSVADGTINGVTTVSGVTVGGSATSLTFAGSASALNTYFATAGNITYRGALNVNGARTLTVTVSDGSVNTTPVTSTINITAVNDAPVRTAGTTVALTVNEDSANSTAVSLGLSAYTYGPGGGSDESSQTLTYKITGIPSSITLWKTDGTTQVNNNDTLSLADIQGLKYKTVANANNSTPANITWTVTDDGASPQTLTETLSVTVNPVNDAPLLTATPVNSTFTEGVNSTQAAPVNVFSNALVNTIEAGQTITSLTFTVSGLSNGANDVVVVDGSVLSINAGTSGTTATNVMTYTVSISSGVATITLTKAGGITAQQAQTLINGITYQNTRVDNPTAGSRLFTLTQIKDDGGTTNGGVDTTAPNIVSTVNVVAVNDAPTLAGTNTPLSYTENASPTPVNPNITVADSDNSTLVGATVSVTGNFATGQDVLGFTNVVSMMGNITGSYSATSGVLTLTSQGGTATLAQWQAALRAVTYSNSSDNPTASRTISFVVNDGTANSSVLATTVNITAVNDAPVGQVRVSGSTTVNSLLTAFSDFSDADGLGAITYQWQSFNNSSWGAIAGATNSTYALTSSDTSKTYRAVATYTDGGGTTVSVNSPQFVVGTAETAPPVLKSVSVSNTAINMTFNEALIGSTGTPAAGTFTLNIFNSSNVSTSVSNLTVKHPLNSFNNQLNEQFNVEFSSQSILGGGISHFKLTYTDPTTSNDSNALQDTSGNDVPTFNLYMFDSSNNSFSTPTPDANYFIGGAGNDTITGGTGNDTFMWLAGDAGTTTATDTIKNFTTWNGTSGDRLDLSALLTGGASSSTTLSNWIKTVATGQTVNGVANSTVITIDVDGAGSGTVTQVINLEGVNLLNGVLGTTLDAQLGNLKTNGVLIA